MRRFYAPTSSFIGSNVTLDESETRHLRDVLRLRTGDEVSVFDGAGREFLCTIEKIEKRRSELTVISEIASASPESPLEITLAVAILKGEKFDLVIQKAVELGVDTVVPLQTVRGDVKLNDVEKRLERWRRIALEATKQCGRSRLMQITEPAAFESIITGKDNIVLFSEREGKGFSTIKSSKKITALVGPEGGWGDSELMTAKTNKVSIVTFGGRILRAETAAISVAAILQHRFGDIN